MTLKKLNKTVDYVIIQGMGMAYNKKFEGSGKIFYRRYIPKISELTSINAGLAYYYLKAAAPVDFYFENNKITYSILSIPFNFQQAFLRGLFRPYAFAGFALVHTGIKESENIYATKPKGFQKSFGLALSAGGGIEWNISNSFMLQAEYRHEVISHLVRAGIAYIFQIK